MASTLVVGDMAATAAEKSLARRGPTKSAAKAKVLHDSELVRGTALVESAHDVEKPSESATPVIGQEKLQDGTPVKHEPARGGGEISSENTQPAWGTKLWEETSSENEAPLINGMGGEDSSESAKPAGGTKLRERNPSEKRAPAEGWVAVHPAGEVPQVVGFSRSTFSVPSQPRNDQFPFFPFPLAPLPFVDVFGDILVAVAVSVHSLGW